MSNRISYFLSTNVLLRIYRQNIIPIFDYGGIVWGDCGKQTLCAHKIKQCVSPQLLIANLVLRTCVRRWLFYHCFFSQFIKLFIMSTVSTSLERTIQLRDHNYTTERCLRDATQLDLRDTMSSAMGQSLFKFAAAKDWNHLPNELGELGSISSFKTEVFKYLLELDQKQHVCTAKYYFFFFWIFTCIFNFCVRLPLILKIFSIHNSFIMFFDYY